MSGCGSRIPTVAAPNESIAGIALTRDATEYIINAEREDSPAVRRLTNFGVACVVAKRMGAEPDTSGKWVEIWEVQRDGVRVAYSIAFTPDGSGAVKVSGKLLGEAVGSDNANLVSGGSGAVKVSGKLLGEAVGSDNANLVSGGSGGTTP